MNDKIKDDDNTLDKQIQLKAKDNLLKNVSRYRDIVLYLQGNVPIEVLAFPASLNTILRREGIDTVIDLFKSDINNIRGIGYQRRYLITTALDEFFSMNM